MTNFFKNLLKQTTSAISIVAITVQPVLAQVVGGDNAPEIIAAPNGVAVVNINSANGNGVSLNSYTDFSVGAGGLILNNIDTNFATTQLGGIIEGNTNLSGGAASLIINEVIANNPSVLNGFLEVGGVQANVIVANPYGITCDGCGFINMDRMTLTTGSTVFEGGAFTGISVDDGAIAIGAVGANALGATQFDLISRQISVAGAVVGQRIKIVAGRNDVVYATGEVIEKAADGSAAPALAIDSSVLGGMYGDSISFISTEDGVGVRAPTNMAANAGGMHITADGRLVMGSASAQDNISITTTTGDVVVEKTLVGTGIVEVSSAQDLILEADAQLVSQSALMVDAFADINLGTDSQVVSAGSIGVTAGEDVTLGDGVSIVSYADVSLTGINLVAVGQSTIAAGAADAVGAVALASLDLAFADGIDLSGALVVSSDALNVTARILDIAEDGAIPAGRFVGFGDVAIIADTVTAGADGVAQSLGDMSITGNTGALQVNGGMFQSNNLTLEANGLDLNADFQAQNGTLTVVSSAHITNAGSLLSNNGISLDAAGLFTNEGQVQGGGNVVLAAADIINSNSAGNGVIQSLFGGVGVSAIGDVTNEAGAILTATSLISISADGTLTNAGEITSDGALQIGGNSGDYLGGLVNTADGEIIAAGSGQIQATTLENIGAIASEDGQLLIRTTGRLENRGLLFGNTLLALLSDGNIINDTGAIVADQDIAISGNTNPLANKFVNRNGGLVETFNGDIRIEATLIRNMGPTVTISSDVVVTKKKKTDGDDSGWSRDYVTTRTTTTVTTQIATVVGVPSQIIGGRDIALIGEEGLNSYSLISATGNILLDLDSFENAGLNLTKTTEVTRRIHIFKRNNPWTVKQDDKFTETDPAVVATIGRVFSTIEAGGAIVGNVSGFVTNGAVSDGGNTVGGTGVDVNIVTTQLDPDELTNLTTDISSINPDAVGNPNLFVVNTDPTAEFLLETRYEFIDISQFLSSDYFLSSIDYNADAFQLRLGDAYVETQFIRDQLFDLTGTRLTDTSMDERAIIQSMYDGAIDASESLNLQVGIALTSEQVAALTSDIIWLEEVNVDGRTVLVPRVYLASTDTLLAAQTGAKIQSLDIALMVGEFTNNGGLVAADNSLLLQASGDILNLGGTLEAGNLLALNTLGDLRSVSGMITATDVAITAENIFIETASIRSGDTENFADAAGVTSGVVAGNALSLNAANDITFTGADVTAGGDASVIAGGDIVVGALQLLSESNTEWTSSGFFSSSEGYSHTESLMNQVSNIDVGGNLAIISTGSAVDAENTGNVVFEGANVTAGGDLQIAAFQGNVILAAVADTYYLDSSFETSGLISGASGRTQIFDLTHQVTTLTAGDIDVYAAGSIIAEATEFHAFAPEGGGNLTLTAETGDVALLAVTDVHATSVQYENEVLWGLAGSSADIRTLQTNSYGSVANISGDIVLNAGNDLIMTAVDFDAGGSFTTNVAGDTYLLAAVDTDYASSVTMDNNAIIITDTTQKDLTQSVTYNEITAAGGWNFDPNSLITFDAYRDALSGGDPASLIGDVGGFMNIAGVALDLDLKPEDSDSDDGDDGESESDDYTILTASMPTAADGIEFAYIDELIARDTTINNSIELLDYHFYDQQKQLSPAFKALIAIAVSQFTGGLGLSAFLEGALSSAITETIAGAVSGDLDLGDILAGAVFSGVSSWATELVSLDTLGIDLGAGADDALLGFGSKFTLTNIVEGGLDSFVSAGLNSAVYGTDFGEGFVQGFTASMINLATADFQHLVGDQGLGEGSFEHMLLHGIVGCVSAEASGANCSAGAVGGITQSLYAGYLETNGLSTEHAIQTAALLGGGVGFLFSGGEAINVSTASGISSSGIENNYLTHEQWNNFLDALEQCGDDQICIETRNNAYGQLSALQQHEIAMCGDNIQCLAPHLLALLEVKQNATELTDRVRDLRRGVVSNGIWQLENQAHDVYLGAGLSPYNPSAVYLEYGAWANSNCEGISGSDCMIMFQDDVVKRDAYFYGMTLASVSVAGGIAVGLTGGLILEVGPAAIASLRTCLGNLVCVNELGILAAEAAAGDALSGGSISLTVTTVGRVAFQKGDQLLGLLDDAGRLLTRVDDATDLGRFVFRGEDGSLHILDEVTGDLAAFTRSVDVLAPNRKIPSVKDGEFANWFDDLSPAELDVLWKDDQLRLAIESRIRQPGALHEWCMVCRAPDFKRWGVSMDEIQRFRTGTTDLVGTNPHTGEAFAHSVVNEAGDIVSGPGSKTFHNELQQAIDDSTSLTDFNRRVIQLRDDWKIDPSLMPSLPQAG